MRAQPHQPESAHPAAEGRGEQGKDKRRSCPASLASLQKGLGGARLGARAPPQVWATVPGTEPCPLRGASVSYSRVGGWGGGGPRPWVLEAPTQAPPNSSATSAPSPPRKRLRKASAGARDGKTKGKDGSLQPPLPTEAQAHRDPCRPGARERRGQPDRSACRRGRGRGCTTAPVHCTRDAPAACAAARSRPPAG